MKVSVCVGSSCHLKGSYEIIQIFKAKIAEHHLEEQIELKASFCLGHCTHGVSVRINEDQFLEDVNPENAAERFEQDIMSRL